MHALKTLLTLSALALLTACAGTTPYKAAPADPHAGHHPGAAPAAAPAAPQDRMKAMQAMHDKVMNAKTPEERQALMADHMKAMHEGMDTMKGMKGMGGMGGMGKPADPAQQRQMLEMRMDMMQTMMEMMMQRLPGAPAPAPVK